MLSAQNRVAERFLDQSLTIVEGAVDAQRQHVIAPAGQLPLLPRAYQASGVKDDHLRPGATMKSGGDCASRIPRGRDQNGQRLGTGRVQALLALRQKSGAEVLE